MHHVILCSILQYVHGISYSTSRNSFRLLTQFQAVWETLQKHTLAFIMADCWQPFTSNTRLGKTFHHRTRELNASKCMETSHTTDHYCLQFRSTLFQHF